MKPDRPMGFTQAVLDHWRSTGKADVAHRLAGLEELYEAFKDIPASVLDRIARVIVREQPQCDAILRKFSAHTQHRDDGIGDLLAVSFSIVVDNTVREMMCALYLDTVALAMEARSQGRFDYGGLSHAAVSMKADEYRVAAA